MVTGFCRHIKYFIILGFSIISFYGNSQQPISADASKKAVFIDSLISRMTLAEKIGQLNLLVPDGEILTGQGFNLGVREKVRQGLVGGLLNVTGTDKVRNIQKIAIEESRLKIPLLFGMDVIHGYKTIFPIPLGLAAGFDPDLVEQLSRLAATEASADGVCWTYSPMVDIARDPRWGRIAEGAGEDPYLGSRMAEAYVKGYQGKDLAEKNTILSCVKHFALYGAAEAGRDYNTVDMSPVRMYNEYFPPYQAAITAGAGSVMTSFNEINGVPASANPWLLTEVLRNQWKFNGFVVTDFTAIEEMVDHGIGDFQQVAAKALKAGVDMEMVGECFINTLKKSLQEGKIKESQINQACRRILEAKYNLGLFEDPYHYCNDRRARKEIFTEENIDLVRTAAAQTFVLLKNADTLLPLKKEGRIALIGPLADNPYNMAGCWAGKAEYEQCVTVLNAFKKAVGKNAEILYSRGCNIVDDPDLDRWTSTAGHLSYDSTQSPEQQRDAAVMTAYQSDVVVAVLGESAQMSGESACRTNLGLPGSQQELLKALINTGKPVILLLFTGRPLVLTWENEHIPAILNVWFPGTQAGNAIADVVFGKVNPGGKLPATFPQNTGQIPLYYNHKNTGRPLPEDEWFQKYISNYLDVSNDPLYPFGYGLSYTSFTYGELMLDTTRLSDEKKLNATIQVSNTGQWDGTEVVQLYIRDLVGSITRPVQELKGFRKIFLKAGESQQISFTLSPEDLKFYNADLDYVFEPGAFEIMAGGNSRDVKTATVVFQ